MKRAAFSDRLKHAITVRMMKQIELCEKTNIPKSAMSQYVSGSFEPKQDRVAAIAAALNVSEAWLMGYDVPMENTPLQSHTVLSNCVREIVLTSHEESVIIAYRNKPAIQPAVDKLLDVSSSEEPEILKAAARNGRHLSPEEIERIKTLITEERGGHVPPEVIQELIDKVDTLPDFVD